MAVHPNDSNQVVHAGVEIFKFNNVDSTLSYVSGLPPHVEHHNYAHDPSNPGTLYIACDGGVYRSTDFGDSYQSIGYGLQTAQFYNGFSCSTTDSALAIGGYQDNGTNIYYGDKGNWIYVLGGDGCWTGIDPIDDNNIYCEWQYNSLCRSNNRGANFTGIYSSLYGNAAFVAPFIIAPSHPAILYSGRDRVFKTEDAGDSWSATAGGVLLDNGNMVLSMSISATNPDKVYVGTAPLYVRGHIFRTVDGGDTWQDVTGPLPDRYPMDIAVDPNNDHTVYVVFAGFGSGHVFKSVDGGDNWQDITGSLPDVPTLNVCVDPINSDHIYVGNDLGVYVSTDAGTTWETYNNGLPEAVIAMDLNAVAPHRKLRVATHGNGAYERPLVYLRIYQIRNTLSDQS